MSELYYTESKSWYQEHYESLHCARNRYRLACFLLLILLFFCILAIITLLPLKQYIYRLIEVNQTTGEVLVLKEVEGNKFKENWVVDRYFIHQYIDNRESYSFEDIKRKFNLVIDWSDKKVADIYIADTVDTNPISPIKILNKTYYKQVNILSINPLNDHTAIARYQTVIRSKDNVNEIKTADWQAVIKWDYVDHRVSQSDRDNNPLGFTITYYQVSPVLTKENI